jgi:hypothetical protein
MNVPSSRQLVTLTFTNGRGDSIENKELQAQNVIDRMMSNGDDDDLNVVNSECTTSSTLIGPQNRRTRPPMGKQLADVFLLMENLVAFSKRSEKMVLMRNNNTVGDDYMLVFLVPKCWWDLWVNQKDGSQYINLGPINNWSFVDRIVDGKGVGEVIGGREGASIKPISSLSAPLNHTDQSTEQDTKDQNRISPDSRHHLREDISIDDFRIVTYEAWMTLTAWYGGSPSLPALLINLNNHAHNGISNGKNSGSNNGSAVQKKSSNYIVTTVIMTEDMEMNNDVKGRERAGERETNGVAHNDMMEVDKVNDDNDNDDDQNNESILENYDSIHDNINIENLRPLTPLSMKEVLDFLRSGPKNEMTPPKLSDSDGDDQATVRASSVRTALAPSSDCGGYIAKDIIDQSEQSQSVFLLLLLCLLCYVMLYYVSHVMLCYVMSCYVMLCHVMLWYVMLCYDILCNVMLCNVMSCYVMLLW